MINFMNMFLHLIIFFSILFLMVLIYDLCVKNMHRVHKLDYFTYITIFYKNNRQTHLSVQDLSKLSLLKESSLHNLL